MPTGSTVCRSLAQYPRLPFCGLIYTQLVYLQYLLSALGQDSSGGIFNPKATKKKQNKTASCDIMHAVFSRLPSGAML